MAYQPVIQAGTAAMGGSHVRTIYQDGFIMAALGMQRFRRQEQERMHLGDRAVDAPPGSHLPPVQHKPLLRRGQLA